MKIHTCAHYEINAYFFLCTYYMNLKLFNTECTLQFIFFFPWAFLTPLTVLIENISF